MNGASAQAGVTAPTGEPPGLGRAGYVRGRCLICRQARSALSQSRYSDRRGFGLCDDCGAGYRAWERLLASAESSYQPTDVDQQHTRDFNQRLMQHFHRSDDEGRRGIALFMLTGKFASSEWHTLTGSD